MKKLCITFPLLNPDQTLPPKANKFSEGKDPGYMVSLYENFADKILGFIVRHDYNREAAEEILIKVFTTIRENQSLYQPCDKLLLKLIGVAAQHICQEKLVTYSIEKKNCEVFPV
jgi:hypothetical protein